MKEYYSVGEIARIYNVSTDTLRYYDRIDLLKPWKIGENGYRYYSKAQFEIISTIMLLRSMGTPIQDLKKAICCEDPDNVRNEINRFKDAIDKEIERLKELKTEAIRLDEHIKAACYGEKIEIKEVPEMWMFSKTFGVQDELDINEILDVNRLAKKDWTTRASIISTITKENLEAQRFHEYDHYGYLSETKIDVDSPYLKKIEKRLCVVGNAKVYTVEHFEIDEVYKRVIDYAQKQGYEIVGDAIERNILDLCEDCGKNPIMFFRIYIPIKRKS